MAIITVIVLALVGGGTAAALVLSGGHGKASAAPPPQRTPSHTPTPTPTLSSPSLAPSTPTVSPSQVTGPVTVAPGAAVNAQATQIATLLDSYFGAINSHDYQAYIALLSPEEEQGLTATQFNSGFASTKDSNETLQSISAADGATVVTVTFTSHQDPAASANGSESCTNWHVSLYLEQETSSYIIGKPPPSYHAKYAACS